jgi:alkylation response protein AidB-like acyl-CoA dehydrogenase
MFALELSDEQKRLIGLAREFAEQEIRPAEIALDKVADPVEVFASEAYWDVLRRAWEIGFHKMGLPKDVGGLGVDRITSSLVLEELCRGGVGFANAISISGVVAGMAVLGGDSMRKRFVEPFCEDTKNLNIGALAVVEPGHGSDLFDADVPEIALDTRARMKGDDYVVNGAKAGFVSNGGLANAFVLSVALQPELGMRGTGTFLIPADLPGISRGRPLDKLGLRCLNQAEVYLDDVVVPAEFLAAPPNPEFHPVFMDNFLCGGNTFVGMTAVGIMRAAYEEALAYAQERIQGGKPIFEHQHIALKLFDAYTTIQAARSFLLHSIATNETRFPGDVRLAIAARCYACNQAVRVTSDMIQVLGGYGISREYPLEKHMRDAKLTQIEDGTVDTLGLLAAQKLEPACGAIVGL